MIKLRTVPIRIKVYRVRRKFNWRGILLRLSSNNGRGLRERRREWRERRVAGTASGADARQRRRRAAAAAGGDGASSSYFFAGILRNLQYRQSRDGDTTFLHERINMHTLGIFTFYGLRTEFTERSPCKDEILGIKD